jgi:3-oxoadipate enol-lactonase
MDGTCPAASFDDIGPRQAGEPPVVLVHGASSHRAVWDPLVGTLRHRRRVIVVDIPGHGSSPGPAPTHIAGWAEALRHVQDALAIAKWVVVGHSTGGAAAQLYYRKWPESVTALGLISTAPSFHVTPDLAERWLADPELYRREESERLASHGPPSLRRRLDDIRQSNGATTIQNDLRTILSWRDGSSDPFGVPLLILTSTRDHPGMRAAAMRWKQSHPRATFIEMQGVGHMMMVEDPAGFAAAVKPWLVDAGRENQRLTGSEHSHDL